MKNNGFLKTVSFFLATVFCLSALGFFQAAARGGTENVKIRVGSYNIQNGGRISHDFSVLAADLASAGLDIVGLQEVDKNTARNGGQDTLKAVSEASNGLYPYYGYSKAISFDGGEYGTGILSKYPIESFDTVALPGPGEGRSLGHAVINVNGTLIDFYNTHLEWSASEGRKAQLAFIKTVFEGKDTAILTGDLNTPKPKEYAPSFPLCNFANGFDNIYVTNEDGPIDNIISTKNRFIQTATGIVENDHSDHYMLWADLEILPEPALREEDGGVRFYEDGAYLTGLQTLGYDRMYFDPDTGLMVNDDFSEGDVTYVFETFTACGKTLSRLVPEEDPVLYPRIFDPKGTDFTDQLTDGNNSNYISDSCFWYCMPEEPVWTIEQGVLEIGGIGQLEAGENFGRFNDDIHTIVVAPQDPSIKYGGDFGVQTGVVLESIGSGAFSGLTNVTKAYIPDNVSLADDAFDAGVSVEIFRTPAKTLTVAPATGYGIVNEGGKTLLKLTVKDGENDLVLEQGQKIAVLYTDGEKRNEGEFFCSAIKYSELQPTYENGVFVFDICTPDGENQFIPQYECTYIVNLYVLNADGSIAALGSSKQFAVRCTAEPIFTERTSQFVRHSPADYLTIDLGDEKSVTAFGAAFVQDSRYYHWQLYGSNDVDLPLCKWVFLGEKSDNTPSNEGMYSITVDGTECRYLRICTSYASSRWTALYSELSVTAKSLKYDEDVWGYNDAEHWHVYSETFEEVPGTRQAHIAGNWIADSVNGVRTKVCAACGKVLETEPLTYPYITNARGDDVTAEMTDGSVNTYLDGDSHWYFQPEGPIWTIEQGVLEIGGIGQLEAGENFGRFNDEIHTIVVAPQDPSIKYGGDFGVQTGVVLESIGSGAFSGLTNVTKAYIPDNISLADDAFDAGVSVEIFRTPAKTLTVAPATGYGIVNEGGKTLLKLTVKDGANDLVLEQGQKIVALYTDGEKNNEAGSFFCAALKYSELQPTYENGVFVFDICTPDGENQFIPQYSMTYIVNLYVLNADGSIAALGSSEQFAIRCNVEPIFTERTSQFVRYSPEDYLTVDLGEEKPVVAFGVAYANYDRYYQWQLYGTNDPALPLCKWDYLGEKIDHTSSTEGLYTIDLDGTAYRYLRVCTSYASARWTALYSEVSVTIDPCAEGHTPDEGTVTALATFLEDGTKECVCTVCGKPVTVVIPKAQLGVYRQAITGEKDGKKTASVIGTITCDALDLAGADKLAVTLVFKKDGAIVNTKNVNVQNVYNTVIGLATNKEDTALSQGVDFIDATYLFGVTVNGIPEGAYTLDVTLAAVLDGAEIAVCTESGIEFEIA